MKSRTSQFALRTWILLQTAEVVFLTPTTLSLSCQPSLTPLMSRVCLHLSFTYQGVSFGQTALLTAHFPILVNKPKMSVSIPIFQTQDHPTRLGYTQEIPTLSELTSLQVLTLETNSIASGPSDVSSQCPLACWLPNSRSASTLLSLTRYALLLKRPIREGRVN